MYTCGASRGRHAFFESGGALQSAVPPSARGCMRGMSPLFCDAMLAPATEGSLLWQRLCGTQFFLTFSMGASRLGRFCTRQGRFDSRCAGDPLCTRVASRGCEESFQLQRRRRRLLPMKRPAFLGPAISVKAPACRRARPSPMSRNTSTCTRVQSCVRHGFGPRFHRHKRDVKARLGLLLRAPIGICT